MIAAGIFQKQIIPAPNWNICRLGILRMMSRWIMPALISLPIENASYLLLMIADLFESPEEKDDRQKNLEVLTLSSLGQWGYNLERRLSLKISYHTVGSCCGGFDKSRIYGTGRLC